MLSRGKSKTVFESANPATQLLILAEVARGSTLPFSAKALDHKTVIDEFKFGIVDIEKRIAIADACERLFRASKED